ncbi:transcription initiation factor IIB family protein [Salinigranum halophilum]|uniref:hypothetical protein n=1 Tax=Salinigranum halophilum TaxID=2565931 RepID=UPI00115F11DD
MVSHGGNERTLRTGLREIDRMASALGLPQAVTETGSMVYRRIHDEGFLHGRTIEGCASAALYAGARIERIPRGIAAVVCVSRVERKRIERAYRAMLKEFRLGVPPVEPTDVLPQILTAVDASSETESAARQLLREAMSTDTFVGRYPGGVAAGVVYCGAVRPNRGSHRQNSPLQRGSPR